MAIEFNFLETGSKTIYDIVIDSLMDHVNEPLYPGDERRIFAEAVVMLLVSAFNKMNDTARQKTLQYARGNVLDAIGDMASTPRLSPKPPHDVVRFSTQDPADRNIVIPEGTRVTPDGQVYFSTRQAAVLQTGKGYVDVDVYCQEEGSDYDGLAPGTLNVLVDVIPYIYSVSNLNGTSGGDNGEPYNAEGDNRYRERIKLANSSFSVAGPIAAYKYHVMSADPDISDVQVDSPSGAVVNIYVLMKDGEIPDQETIEKIEKALEEVRPMTDKVTVKPPTVVEYGIEVKYCCTLDNEPQAVETVEDAGGSIDTYNAWQTAEMGRDINPDQLKKHILAPDDGHDVVDRADIIAPEFTSLEKTQIARFNGSIKISHEVTG